MIPHLRREDLFEMSTDQLYALDGELTALQEMVSAELILRGDY